ncbi:hypothetical protein [Terriglobus roseus]|uniref:Uncharacterized protein n=1 Tax=Terriglobus roseus TaxID=392734 RepID=A0A1H4JDR7_9BACT|nr:hypothetical protein [Terriglobus roseus]SEB44433.1 hypothetical protein SAMN05443244_0552 [Terriglobus roseus]
MKWDYRHHLLLQIEMLRGDVSHEELSERLGETAERCLARYLAGKQPIYEKDLILIAKAVDVAPQMLAEAWASSLGLRVSSTDGVGQMYRRAYDRWRHHSRICGVPSSPSPMAIIRAKYAHRLPRKIPSLWCGSHFLNRSRKDTLANRARFARAYKMLLESVHDRKSHREIGARHGISGERARQLMVDAAYTWARSEKIDLSDRSVGFKKEGALIRNLYAALRFFARQEFNALAAEDSLRGMLPNRDKSL